MKFTNKQLQFQSKKNPYPTYMNSYIRDGKIEIGENSEYLQIDYLFCHEVNQTETIGGEDFLKTIEVIINRSSLRFTEAHEPTIIKEGDEKIEVYEAILSGITYDKSKVVTWGKPDLHKVMGMFLHSSLTSKTGLVIKDLNQVSVQGNMIDITPEQSAQIKQLMIDWLQEKVVIENEKLGVNFEIEIA